MQDPILRPTQTIQAASNHHNLMTLEKDLLLTYACVSVVQVEALEGQEYRLSR
jgi:hypothetical protein